MRQSKAQSLIEAAANVLIGFVIAVATQVVVFPWFGLYVSTVDHIGISLCFLVVSMGRSYIIRRYFDRMLHLGAKNLAARVADSD